MKIRPNYIYALISMTLVLFLAGVFGSIITQSQQLVKLFKERVMLVVELENGYPKTAIDDLETIIAAKDYVKKNSLEFVSKAEAAKIMQEDFGAEVDLSQFNLVNPLYDIFTFYVNAENMNMESLKKISESLEQDERISDVSYEGSVAGTISGYWNRIGWIGLAVSLILVIVAVFLIIYAVRQALYSDRFLIKNMHLVGATPSFINRPYARRGVLGGLLSALVAGGALMILRWWLITQIPGMEFLFTLSSFGFIFALMLALGVVVTAGSTWLTVRNFLKSDVNELYN